jgi:hypothetical protein
LGIQVVRVKVRAWNKENIVYGSRATAKQTEMSNEGTLVKDCELGYVLAIGLEVHQKKASRRYWTFCY